MWPSKHFRVDQVLNNKRRTRVQCLQFGRFATEPRHTLFSVSRCSILASVELCWVLERLGRPLLHLRQHTLGKEFEASFDFVKRHTRVTEVQHEAIGVD